MPVFRQTVQTYDFGATPAVFKIFTIPKSHTIARIFSTGLTYPVGGLAVRVGTGGVIDSGASDYTWGCMENDSTWRIPTVRANMMADNVTSGGPWHLNLFNMNTAAPVSMIGVGDFAADTSYSVGMRRSIAKRDQIEIRNENGTNITAGVVRVVSYARKNKVTARATPAQDEVLTGLKKARSGLIVVSAYDLSYAVNNNTGKIRVGDSGGVKEDANYRTNKVGSNAIDEVTNATSIGSSGATNANQGAFGVVLGLAESDIQSVLMHSGDMGVGAGAFSQHLYRGWYNTVEAHDRVAHRSDASTTSTGGTLYFTEYVV